MNAKTIPGITGKVVYLSGAITSDPNFKEKFAEWEEIAKASGALRVFNPVRLLQPGYEYEEYMEVDLIFVRRAECIIMLPCWSTSPGAKAERAYAECLKRTVVEV